MSINVSPFHVLWGRQCVHKLAVLSALGKTPRIPKWLSVWSRTLGTAECQAYGSKGTVTPGLDVDLNMWAWRRHGLRWEVRLCLPKEVLYTSVLFCLTGTSVQDSSENWVFICRSRAMWRYFQKSDFPLIRCTTHSPLRQCVMCHLLWYGETDSVLYSVLL